MDQTISPQSQRLKAFIQETGMSVTEFGNQCKIKSSSSLHGIVSEGKAPSSKVLDKIITRFPALNYDWVILGYGEMIIPGMTKQPASGTSVLKSKGAAFQQISDKQIETSFGINELALKVEQAMALNAQTTQLLTNKVEQMAITIKEGQDFIIEKEAKRDAFFNKMHADEMLKIKALDKERRENRIKGQAKLSDKIHGYLQEGRELVFAALNSAKEEAIIKNRENINEGIELLNEAMHENAINQTEYAIKKIMDKLNPKNLFSKIGSHTKIKKS